LNYIALTGALASIGRAEGPPVPPLNLVGDFGGGGMLATTGVLAAYVEALRSGRGQVVDVAMVDGATLLMAHTYGLMAAGKWSPNRGSNLFDGSAPWYGVYETSDGKYISLAAVESHFFSNFLELAEIDASVFPDQMDKDRWQEGRQIIANKISTRTLDAWCSLFEGTDACFAPVLRMDEAYLHTHMGERQAFIEVESVLQPAPAPRFSRTPSRVSRPSPRPGEHSAEILSDWGAAESD